MDELKKLVDKLIDLIKELDQKVNTSDIKVVLVNKSQYALEKEQSTLKDDYNSLRKKVDELRKKVDELRDDCNGNSNLYKETEKSIKKNNKEMIGWWTELSHKNDKLMQHVSNLHNAHFSLEQNIVNMVATEKLGAREYVNERIVLLQDELKKMFKEK